MSTPYRGGPGGEAREAPEDAGLVGDLIQQFADPYAFYRELVQNSIDAETDAIHALVAWSSEDGGTARISVRDAGTGMDREVLENQLVVLFRSGKEGQEGKIGKFGVGFVSVLAMAPRRVVVTTSRGDGVTWTMVLYPDHTYELFESPGGEGRGTSVTLEVPLAGDRLAEMAERSEAALRKWCRHARVPIHLRVASEGATEPLLVARIDEPLGLEALVSVTETSADGHTTAVVGVREGGESYAGFFNTGLLLWEGAGTLDGLAFKVQDARLEHTLSRDNVRRDRHFDAAVAFAQRAARTQLPAALLAALGEALDAGDAARFRAVLRGWLASGLGVTADEVVLPLCAPWRDRERATVGLLRKHGSKVRGQKVTWLSRGPSDLTRALADRDVPVVDARIAGQGAVGDALLDRLLVDVAGLRALWAHKWLTCVHPEKRVEEHARLLEEVRELLALVHDAPSRLLLARLDGAGDDRLSVALPEDEEAPWVLDEEARDRSPFKAVGLLDRRRPALALNPRHPLVFRALERAAEAPRLAATVLAQALLVQHGAAVPERTERLVARALDATLGEGG